MIDVPPSRRGLRPGLPPAACGALILVLALSALVAPFAAPGAAGLILATALIGAAVVGAAALIALRSPGAGWRLGWVCAAGVAGLAVLGHHWTGVGSLRWILAVAAVLLTAPLMAAAFRRDTRPRLWPLLAAAITLGVGGLVVWAAPHAGMMVLSVFLAANMAAFGAALILRSMVQFLGATLL